MIHSRFLRVILDPWAMLIFSVSFQFLRMMPKHSDLMITAAFPSGRRLPRSIIVMWRAQARLEKLLSGSGEHHRAGHWLKFSTSNQMASVYTSRAHLLPPVQERCCESRSALGGWSFACVMGRGLYARLVAQPTNPRWCSW